MKLLAAAAAALLLAAPASGGGERPTLSDLEDEVVCPSCRTTIDQSNAPVAERMRSFILERIAAGDTKGEIKAALVDEFGPRVVEPAPPARGFSLLAWLLPISGLFLAAGAVVVLAWRWSRGRETPGHPRAGPSRNGRARLDPELERRLDEELARYDA